MSVPKQNFAWVGCSTQPAKAAVGIPASSSSPKILFVPTASPGNTSTAL